MNKKDERVKGKGGSRWSLELIDGNVPVCMRNQDKDAQLNRRRLKEREEKSEADIVIVTFKVTFQMCMRREVEEK